MKRIEIKTSHDVHDCDACGTTYAMGGIVYIDGRKVIGKEPVAHCCGSTQYDEADLLVMALAAVGVEVKVDGRRYEICCHDDEYHGGEENALKPCPFCGNAGSGPIEDALHVSEMDMQGTWKASYAYSVQCDKCTATMGYSESEEEAIAAWNNRAAVWDALKSDATDLRKQQRILAAFRAALAATAATELMTRINEGDEK